MLRPDRKYPVIGDTHDGSGISAEYVEILADHFGARYAKLLETVQGAPLAKRGGVYALWHRDPDLKSASNGDELPLRAEYFPGWQVGVLRSGNDASQTSFYFNGYAAHGHRHYDTLGILYHAYNTELASDRGYIWDDPRNAWTKSTLSHNIVTVDGKSQDAKNRRSSLELFAVAPRVEIIQASAEAYKQCSEYRRTCALVRLPEGGNYVVDIFRLQGGALHQYGLNCNGKFVGFDGAKVAPVDEKIKWMENLRAAGRLPASWNATWEYRDTKFRLTMLGQVDRLLVADAPGWRSYKGDQLHAPPITQILAERSGKSPLQSTYAAVLCPFRGAAPAIRAVRLVPAEPAAKNGPVAVAVERDGATDYVISSSDDKPHSYGPVRLAGRFGMATVDSAGRLVCALLVEGTELACGGRVVRAAEARATRQIVKVDANGVELGRPLPAELAQPGRYVRSGKTAFEIEKVDGRRVTFRDYPFEGGDEITAASQVWFEAKP